MRVFLPLFVWLSVAAGFSRLNPQRFRGSVEKRPQQLQVIPNVWIEAGTLIAELTVTPAVVMYFQGKMKGEVEELKAKYEALEKSSNETSRTAAATIEEFTGDIKGALSAYQDLYKSVSLKVDALAATEQKRQKFENDIEKSLKNLESLAVDVTALRTAAAGSQESSQDSSALTDLKSVLKTIGEKQEKLEKSLETAQRLNARERASIRNDILKEQKNAASATKQVLDGLRSEVDELNFFSQLGPSAPTAGDDSKTGAVAVAVTAKKTDVVLSKELRELKAKLSEIETQQRKLDAKILEKRRDSNENVESQIRQFVNKELSVINDKLVSLETKVDTVGNAPSSSSPSELAEIVASSDAVKALMRDVSLLSDLASKVEELRTLQEFSKAPAVSSTTSTSSGERVEKLISATQNVQGNPEEFFTSLEAANTIEGRLVQLEAERKAFAEKYNADAQKLKLIENDITELMSVEVLSVEQQDIILNEINDMRSSTVSTIEAQGALLTDLANRLEEVVRASVNSPSSSSSPSTSSTAADSAAAAAAIEAVNDLKTRVEELAASTNAELIALKEAVKATNMDIDESVEKIGDERAQILDAAKKEVSRFEQQLTQQLQAVDGRMNTVEEKLSSAQASSGKAIGELSAQVTEASEAGVILKAELLSTVETKISEIDGKVANALEQVTSSNISPQAAASLAQDVMQVVELLKTDVNNKISSVELQAYQRIKTVETKVDKESRRIEDYVDSNVDFLRGSVELRLSTAQKEVSDSTKDLNEKIELLESSLDDRIEITVEKSSLRGRAKNAVVRAFNSVRKGVSGVRDRIGSRLMKRRKEEITGEESVERLLSSMTRKGDVREVEEEEEENGEEEEEEGEGEELGSKVEDNQRGGTRRWIKSFFDKNPEPIIEKS